MVELVVDGRAHARDVHALLVAHGEQQCLGAVDGDILVERGIFVLHFRHIFQSDDVAAQVAVNHRVLHIVDFVEALVDVDGTLVFLVLQASARAGKALSGELLRDGQIADAVLGELVGVEIDGDLRHLHARDTHLAHRGHHAQRVLDDLHVLVELTIGLVLALQGDELRRHVAEIVLHANGHNTTRQARLERCNTMLELRPELVLVLKVLIELHHDNAHAVARVGIGLLLQYFFVAEDVVLQRFGHLLFHLFRRGARKDGGNDALAHRVVGKLVLVDHLQTEDAKHHQAAHQQDDDLPVIEADLLKMSSLLPCHSLT